MISPDYSPLRLGEHGEDNAGETLATAFVSTERAHVAALTLIY